MKLRIVLMTFPSGEAAEKTVTKLLEEKLIACANIVPTVQSHYWWEGKIESSTEALVILKTSEEIVSKLEARAIELHPYDTPEFVTIEPESVHEKYLSWVTGALRPE